MCKLLRFNVRIQTSDDCRQLAYTTLNLIVEFDQHILMTEEIGHGFLPGVPRQRVWFHSDQTQQNFKDHRSTSDHVLRLGFCFNPLGMCLL
jgi:adenosyl cobinamide kinase/adenosyl cobinamide phosphate guanylyltransferase